MILLVTTSLPTVLSFESPYLGRLFTPRMMSNAKGTSEANTPWAADNDGFNGYGPEAFKTLLRRITGYSGCLFVTAPDALLDAPLTLERFNEWEPVIRSHNLPVALVGQDGMERLPIPWERLDTFFVGGSTDWKIGSEAAGVVAEAKARGKWVHMGRVNQERRIVYARSIGCDSIDGSSFGRFPKKYIPNALRVLNNN